MPLRVRPDEVQGIIDTDVDVLPFLRTASLLVDTHLLTSGLSAPVLREIELYLAAWVLCARDPRFTQASTDGQSMTFAVQSYWEMVTLLDTTGILAQVLAGTKRISIKVF